LVKEWKGKKRDRFDYPVWIDTEDSFNGTNKLPDNSIFHSFLIDRQNKVAAVGNPFENPKIKELYLNMLCGELKQNRPDVKNDVASLTQHLFFKTAL
jgi:hypothetical protein